MSDLRITIGDTGVVHLIGPVTMETTPDVTSALRASRSPITLDLSEVTAFDDSGSAMVLRLLRRAPVTLLGASPAVIDGLAWARMLELPGLTIEKGSEP